MLRIFISYRRQDSALMTGRIYDRLENVFGGNRVFRDIDDINAGEDFRAKLAKEIDSCDILLVMIGPKWENITDALAYDGLSKVMGEQRRYEINTFDYAQ